MKYKVIKEYNGLKVGDIVELNERRAKSEVRHGNVIEAKAAKKTAKQKMEKITYKNKAITKRKIK
jgi:hypothetical protein